MKILDTPVYMTVEEATDEYYPNSVVMINCEVEHDWPKAGYVAAAETEESRDYSELKDYEMELKKDSKNGEVCFIKTRYPLEGQALFVGQCYVEE